LTEKGGFVKRGIKKTAQEKLLFGGTRPGDFGRVRKIVRTIVDLQTEPILRSGSQFFFNNMELAPSFLSDLLVPKFSLDQLFQMWLILCGKIGDR